jgi:acetolactate synthase small subunit
VDALSVSDQFSASVTTPAANTYEGQFTFGAVEAGQVYRVIAVFYNDTTGHIGSFISAEYTVDTTPPDAILPGIVSKIRHYAAENETAAMENVAVFDRYECQIEIDKTVFNAFDVGDWGDVVLNVKVGVGQETITAEVNNLGNMVSQNPSVLTVVSETASLLVMKYALRIKREWAGTTVYVDWVFEQGQYPSQWRYRQRFSVSQLENDKVSPIINTMSLAYTTGGAINVKLNVWPEWIKVLANIDTTTVPTKLLAVKSQSGVFTEHEIWNATPPFLAQIVDSDFRNVDEEFVADNADYEVSTVAFDEGTILAVIAKEYFSLEAVTDLIANYVSGDVILEWTPVNPTADGQRVEISTDLQNWTTIADLTEIADTYTDTGRTPYGVTYHYRISAYISQYISPLGNVASVLIPHPKVYAGMAASPVTPVQVQLLPSQIVGKQAYEFLFTGANKRPTIAYLDSYGGLASIEDANGEELLAGFTDLGTVVLTEPQGNLAYRLLQFSLNVSSLTDYQLTFRFA